MKRRDFFGSVAAAAVTATAISSNAASGRQRKFVELRTYTPLRPEWADTLVELVDKAILPGLERQSIKTAGAFTWHKDIQGNDEAFRDRLFLLIEHENAESFVDLDDRLAADPVFVKDADALLSPLPLKQICADRESSLLHCFPTCPAVEVPSAAPGRLVQLRRYQSRNQNRNAKKIEMFAVRGELDLFRRCEMRPVFFAETLFGKRMPNLTYMLMFDSDEARQKAWKTFVSHPDWKQMSSEPEYEEKGLRITNIFLKPTPGSRI